MPWGLHPYGHDGGGYTHQQHRPPVLHQEDFAEWEHRLQSQELEVAERERAVAETELRLEAYRREAVEAESRRVKRLQEAELELAQREAQLERREAEMVPLSPHQQQQQHHRHHQLQQQQRYHDAPSLFDASSPPRKIFTVQYGDASQVFCAGEGESLDAVKSTVKEFFGIPPHSGISLLVRLHGGASGEATAVCVAGYESLCSNEVYHLRVSDRREAHRAVPHSQPPPQPHRHAEEGILCSPVRHNVAGAVAVCAEPSVAAVVVGVDTDGQGNTVAAEAVASTFVRSITDVTVLTGAVGQLRGASTQDPRHNHYRSLPPSRQALMGSLRTLGAAWAGGARAVLWFCGSSGRYCDSDSLRTCEEDGSSEHLLEAEVYEGLGLGLGMPSPMRPDMAGAAHSHAPLVLIFDVGRCFLNVQYTLKCGSDTSIVAQEMQGIPPMRPHVFVLSVQYLFTTPQQTRLPDGGIMSAALLKVLRDMDKAPTCVEVLASLRLELQEHLPKGVVPLPWLGCSSRLNLASCPFPLSEAEVLES